MLKIRLSHVLFLLLFTGCFSTLVQAQNSEKVKGIQYLSPYPESEGNSVKTNIIIRFSGTLQDKNIYLPLLQIRVQGVTIPYHLINTGDNHKLILQPDLELPAGERIEVAAASALPMATGDDVPAFSYFFKTHGSRNFEAVLNEERINEAVKRSENPKYKEQASTGKRTIETDISNQLPFTISTGTNNENDFYFVGSMFSTKERIMIVNGKGEKVYDRRTPYMALDFKMHPDSTFSFVNLASKMEDYRVIIMDKSFRDIDSINAGNGYILDIHEMVKDPKNGHMFILAQRTITVDLTKIVGYGLTNAKILDLIVQEIDQNHNVVFEWKCWDYLPVSDATGVDLNSSGVIDYVHCNGIMLDTDTTLLLSSRHLNEVTRIDRRDGKIIWRLGPNASSHKFSFINDALGFTYQHHAQKLENGNILLFDNGNYKIGDRFSRAVEYSINEANMTAEKVWEYRHKPDIATDFMGSVQRLPNGRTLIGWGSATPSFTEVDSMGQTVCEGTFPDNILCYRVFKFNQVSNVLKNVQPAFSMPNNFSTCVLNDANYNTKLKASIQNYTDARINQDFQLLTINGNQLRMIMEDTISNTYSFDNRAIVINKIKPAFKDTTICGGAGSLILTMLDGCGGSDIVWNTGESGENIMVTTEPYLNKFWVTSSVGLFQQTDTITLRVSPTGKFDIIGMPETDKPYQILNYSVPYIKNAQYEWRALNGNIISGFETNSIEVQWGNKPQSYLMAYITDAYGCRNSSGWDTIVYNKSTTGIGALDGSVLAGVYPSPFHDVLTMNANSDVSFDIYDLNGKILESGSLKAGQQLQLQTENWPTGLYLVNLTGDTGRSTLKLLKQ